MAASFENLRIGADFTLRICALLRQGGVDVGTQQTLACIEAMLALEHFDEDELEAVYRTTLINRRQDLWQLHRIYRSLLQEYGSQPFPDDDDAPERAGHAPIIVRRRQYSDEGSSADGEESARTESYSIREVDHHRDFRLLPREDVPAAMSALKRVARRQASIARRKTRRAKHRGRVDLRTSARESVKYDGEIVDWRFKHKRPTHSRLVVVSDVSGSMELYSVFLLNFLHLLNAYRRFKIESFVFSTHLECLTKYFRLKSFPDMLRQISLHFSGWSGGTKIGAAIQTLNDAYEEMVTPKTCVIIMSDGWDTGDIALLDREMSRLRRRARSIVWINPLKGFPGYEPLALGMAAARPYCDHFITGHSIDSLEKFAGLLAT